MPHEVVISVEIYYNDNGNIKRIKLPIDTKRMHNPADFDTALDYMNTDKLKMWWTGHLVKEGTAEQVTTSVIIPKLSEHKNTL